MPARDTTKLVEALRAAGKPAKITTLRQLGSRPGTEHLGCTMVQLRAIARSHQRDHALATALWRIPVHEARLLAGLVADPPQLTPMQMDEWVADFDTWDVCDQMCMNAFRHSPHAFDKVRAWPARARIRTSRGLRLARQLGRSPEAGTRHNVPRSTPAHRAGRDRRAKFRQKIRQLGSPPDRQTARRRLPLSRPGSCQATGRPPRGRQCPLDRQRCRSRTPARV